ncbi:hypothetical protein FNU79_17440 [Deinococcus detaillensis]|uniref:Uncharacterized protein n=1 Tax=Deinococcus detaillensis TaxID=2592048 RepID=A0A553UHW5_9DEIO|nr:hypothetical protein [Deinococcus detaillensis]TSA79818.1 hypothetical protein FNU79_17440 [Deinococcus detaillensis]
MTLNQYQQAQAPQIGYRIDNGEARSMRSFYIPNDEEPILNAVNFALNSMFLMPNLLAAKSKIIMTTLSTNGKTLSYTFPTKGLTQALKAVNNCR